MIYLLTFDGGYHYHTDHYATDKAGIEAIVKWYYREYFYRETRNFAFDMENGKVFFEHLDCCDEWEKVERHFIEVANIQGDN